MKARVGTRDSIMYVEYLQSHGSYLRNNCKKLQQEYFAHFKFLSVQHILFSKGKFHLIYI